ncbi:SDR family NAD(P)-dependent oxidoreductase [Bacteroides thetaiotaomicron]|uniref:SDR family NAD(P)-dependent oxidoreductase n=1 Tax=Bacteroides thetaiotaomicron TaxID=818 RepID=UPI0018AA2ABF|nr:SDR family NAD(P)-dependent oxidoreductase [Bacteroides thetaiotaomicron]MDC2215958.1 SDR family NAD(P)-dependent oxidoreductase [Bacteroides thetaiotaomicron]
MKSTKIWLVTGASKGLGLALVKLLLAENNKVVATSRDTNDIEQKIGKHENLLALNVNLADSENVRNAVLQAIDKFGKIDVVVNNAGYSLYGSIESLSDKEFRQIMDINFFGTVNIIRNVMPFLRKQKSGHIINISSVAGYKGYGNSPAYASTKFAVVGLSEALAEEVKAFNIKVTVVAPGFFRTDFLNKGTNLICKNPIPEYHMDTLLNWLNENNGKQAGDPNKLANHLIEITHLENPPIHLLMGQDAYQIVAEKRKVEQEEFEEWKNITFSTNFDE